MDNWTGVALLPLLYEALALRAERRLTFVFVGFTDEEVGLVGSRFYVKQLPKNPPPPIRAMINMDSLGLGPTNVWYSRSDRRLSNQLLSLAKFLEIPMRAVNVDNVGDSDSHPFQQRKIPVLDIHSLTSETLPVLHSPRDRAEAVQRDHYYAAYRLMAGLLAFLDFEAATPRN